MAAREVVWTVVQARLGSTRLPRKVLADIAGVSLLQRCVEDAEQIGYPVCVAIPWGDNTELRDYCSGKGWTVAEGSEDDVLQRYVQTARWLYADHIIRVTSDCPFLDIEAAKWTVDQHLDTGADFTHYKAEGRAVEVFTRHALEESGRLAPRTVGFYREHPDEWILHNPRRYHIETVKFSVDTPEDLERARRRANGSQEREVASGVQSGCGEDRVERGRVREAGGSHPGGFFPWGFRQG